MANVLRPSGGLADDRAYEFVSLLEPDPGARCLSGSPRAGELCDIATSLSG
jgi:hypothetical protein